MIFSAFFLAGCGEAVVPTPSNDVIITRRTVGLNRSSYLEISDKGEIKLNEYGVMPRVRQGAHDYSGTFHVSPKRVVDLIAQFDEAHFFDLAPNNIEQDPPGRSNDYDLVDITFTLGSHSKTVSVRGSANASEGVKKVQIALAEFEASLGNNPNP